MQPTQLSLLPDPLPAPPGRLIDEFPEQDVAAALAALTRLIAKAAGPPPEDPAGDNDRRGSGDE